MAHPIAYDDADPLLRRVRALCAALPDAVERVSHGRPCFFAGEKGRQFATYGGSVMVRPGEHERHDRAVLVKPDPAEAGALDEDPRFFVPAYVGASGWRGLDLDRPDTDWGEVGELLDASYRCVATRRLLARLDRSSEGSRG